MFQSCVVLSVVEAGVCSRYISYLILIVCCVSHHRPLGLLPLGNNRGGLWDRLHTRGLTTTAAITPSCLREVADLV